MFPIHFDRFPLKHAESTAGCPEGYQCITRSGAEKQLKEPLKEIALGMRWERWHEGGNKDQDLGRVTASGRILVQLPTNMLEKV